MQLLASYADAAWSLRWVLTALVVFPVAALVAARGEVA